MNGSGTTMLLDHLSSHPMLYGFPGETKSLPYFIRNQSGYGDLADDSNYRKLWQDMREAVAVPAAAVAAAGPPASGAGGGARSAAAGCDRITRSVGAQHGQASVVQK